MSLLLRPHEPYELMVLLPTTPFNAITGDDPISRWYRSDALMRLAGALLFETSEAARIANLDVRNASDALHDADDTAALRRLVLAVQKRKRTRYQARHVQRAWLASKREHADRHRDAMVYLQTRKLMHDLERRLFLGGYNPESGTFDGMRALAKQSAL